jgi:hypothetical protein
MLREIDSALNLCADFGVASCSSHILCCYNCTLGFILSVYPNSANFKDILLIVPSSLFLPIPSTINASFHSGMIPDNKPPHPHPVCCTQCVPYSFPPDTFPAFPGYVPQPPPSSRSFCCSPQVSGTPDQISDDEVRIPRLHGTFLPQPSAHAEVSLLRPGVSCLSSSPSPPIVHPQPALQAGGCGRCPLGYD